MGEAAAPIAVDLNIDPSLRAQGQPNTPAITPTCGVDVPAHTADGRLIPREVYEAYL